MVAAVDRSDTSARRFRRAASVLRKTGEQARQQGTSISVHTHANCLFESIEDLEKLLGHLKPEECGLTLDTAHAAKAGIQDIASLVNHFRAHLNNVHLKDFSKNGSFCPLGLGTLDLNSVLDALHGIGYDEWLIVDEESRDFTTEEAYRISMDFLDAHR